MADVALELVAMNNEVLATATTDAEGYARIPAGLLKGTGGDRPAVLTARRKGQAGEREGAQGGEDFVFLDLTAAPFDLTDRGVEGRAPSGPLDLFLTTDRGIYRTGETVNLTGVLRNASGDAADPLTLTGIVTRPDGAEHARVSLVNDSAGGFVWSQALPETAMRGNWTFAVHTDPERPALASETALIADFEPEKIDAAVSPQAETLDPNNPAPVTVDARYLFGAPATGLEVVGEACLARVAEPWRLSGLCLRPRHRRAGQRAPGVRARRDGRGRGAPRSDLAAFQRPAGTQPLTASLQVRVIDTDGRPIERTADIAVAEDAARLGLRPRFDGAVPQGSEARFDLVAIDRQGARIALEGAAWTLEEIEQTFQWYSIDGRWNYEPIETRRLVGNGTIDIGMDAPATLAETVDWGRYVLTVTDPDGAALPVSTIFTAGWYVSATSVDTPDVARVSLDRPRYAVGETAEVRIEPRFAGPVEVLVLGEGVAARTVADVGAEGGTVRLPVTRDWGPGAYVVAIAYRPMELGDDQMPGRAIGLAHVAVEPGDRALDVSIEAPERTEPRGPLDLVLRVDGVKPGEDAYVTLAMADEGILNITGFEPPSLTDHLFGQRRLGVAIRDVYGRLIDRMQGALGSVRSGGDAGGSYESPPPMDQLVTAFVGPLKVGPDGRVAGHARRARLQRQPHPLRPRLVGDGRRRGGCRRRRARSDRPHRQPPALPRARRRQPRRTRARPCRGAGQAASA